MTEPARPTPPRYGTAPVAVLTALLVVGLTVWWVQRSAADAERDAQLQAWAGAPLPEWTDPVDTEWIRAMLLAPDSMTTHDPAARSLRARYEVQMMVPGGVDSLRARAIMEFLRRVDGVPS